MSDDTLKEQWAAYKARRVHWRAKNRFYHAYVDRLTHFLIPQGESTLAVDGPGFESSRPTTAYEYILASDLFGYVYDIETFLETAKLHLSPHGRIVITQCNTFWEPVLRIAAFLRLRSPAGAQNWISPHDLKNFLRLAGFEVVHSGSKMLLPKYLPLLSWFLNTVLANLWPFSRLGLIHYVVARRAPTLSLENPSLSIVVPARNEAGTIQRIINELPELGAFTEVIFIEGNSTDDTRATIEREVAAYTGSKRLKFAVQEGKGKGDAVRKGFGMAEGDILAIYDADMTVPPTELEKFYNALARARGEFINGSRLVYPLEKQSMRFLNYVANKFFSLAFSWILGQPVKDTLCGTKVLWKKDYELIAANRSFFGDFDPFGDFDLLFGAAKLNLKIIEVPVHYRDRVYGSTNISRWRHGWLLLKMTLFAARKLKFL